MDSKPRLLLLDGHSLAYRAFFALPVENFSTTTGQVTNAVYGFTSMLINVLRDERPTHIVVAFDVSRRSFRTERYAEYKAGRSETPTDFLGQVSLVQEILAALQIPVVEKPGFEADDVIATLAGQARDAGMDVLICSGDRDAFQLVGESVTVLYPRKGVSDLARVDPAEVMKRYGVGPERYRDLAALVGESSDNLPGVPGVGPKTAAKWIIQYGSLDGVIAHVDEIKGKAGDSVRAHLAGVMRNYELNRLIDDLELPLSPDDARWPGWDREAVHQVFDALEFRILRDRLYQYLEAVEPEAEAGFEMAGEALAPGAVAGWLADQVPAGTAVGVAAAGQFGRGTGALTGVAIATADGPAGWFDPAQLDADDEAAVAAWLADPQRPKVLHDAKPVLLAFAAHGWTLRGIRADTALAAYLARPDQRTYDLTDLALRYLQRELRVDSPADGQLTLDGLGSDGEAERNLMLRARATLDLAGALHAELARDGGDTPSSAPTPGHPDVADVLGDADGVALPGETGVAGVLADAGGAGLPSGPGAAGGAGLPWETGVAGVLGDAGGVALPGETGVAGVLDDAGGAGLPVEAGAAAVLGDAGGAALPGEAEADEGAANRLLDTVELPLIDVLAGMERVGIAADTHYLSELEAHFAAEVKAAAHAAYEVVGREFNLGSPKQLQEILFGELALPKTKKIKTGYTTDADALQSLFVQTGHPLLEHLLRHRDVAKLKSTVDGLLKSVSDDGRIHTTFHQTVAATGRLSSTDPNLQNIPIRTEEGRRIRRAFIVGDQGGTAQDGPFEALMTADYSQIEMRIMAHLSKDEALIESFNSGADFHATTASSVFSVPLAEVVPEQRRRIKAMNYGLAYGLSSYGLAQQLGITPAEATLLMEEYFSRFGGVRDYLREVVAHARHDGYTSTILGRRRYLPDLVSDNRQRREMAERMALNAPIQGSAADIIKVAMLKVDAALSGSGLRSRMLLQVHDELVFEVAAGERADLEALVRREMGGAYPLSVPLEVSVGGGRDWDAADH